MVMAVTVLSATASSVSDVGTIVSGLRSLGDYSAEVKLTVSPPMTPGDVAYTIAIAQKPTYGSDRLSPVDYLIEWRYDSAGHGAPASCGFSAYFDGHHYRFNGERLQEYHVSRDSIPFTGGAASVQRSARFTAFLPGFIAGEIERMASDSRYTLEVVSHARGVIGLRVVMTINDLEAMNADYRFDSVTMKPLRVYIENNPGSITEQPLSAVYSYQNDMDTLNVFSEDALAARYPDAFGRYRESNFRLENLPGSPFPQFSLTSPEGVRFTHHRDEPFQMPVIAAFIDPDGEFTGATVAGVRSAAGALAFPTKIIWIIDGSSPMAAIDVVGESGPDELILLNGASLARECGVVSLPSIVMIDTSGMVGDIAIGYNKNINIDVIQKMSLLKHYKN